MSAHEARFEFTGADGLVLKASVSGGVASVRARSHRGPMPTVRLSEWDMTAWFDVRYGEDFELTVFGDGRADTIARLEALRDACSRALEAANTKPEAAVVPA